MHHADMRMRWTGLAGAEPRTGKEGVDGRWTRRGGQEGGRTGGREVGGTQKGDDGMGR